MLTVGLNLRADGHRPRRLSGSSHRQLAQVSDVALVLSVCGGFFSSVVGGWTAARFSQTVWRRGPCCTQPSRGSLRCRCLVLLARAAGYFGSGITAGGTPVWVTPTVVADPQAAAIMARNGALGALTALLLGLSEAWVGGWMDPRADDVHVPSHPGRVRRGRPKVGRIRPWCSFSCGFSEYR